PHGVRGLITAQCTTDEPELRFRVGSVLLTAPSDRGPLTVAHSHWHGNRLLLGFDGIGDRGAAERLRGTGVLVDSAEVEAPAEPDRFADHQLVGVSVELVSGERVGEILGVEHGPGHDLLVVSHDGREVLVPFVRAIVPTVDLASGRAVIDPPEGLLEL
ncbi:MAG: ribosome maturation factor RimM, partial [Mycobacteriales bacterium]